MEANGNDFRLIFYSQRSMKYSMVDSLCVGIHNDCEIGRYDEGRNEYS